MVIYILFMKNCFNTQPPEGGCVREVMGIAVLTVSTHSRPKAAAIGIITQQFA